ncbi:MAG: InlB B-repeat-containing protein [Erysipelotrichaceae bacterium]
MVKKSILRLFTIVFLIGFLSSFLKLYPITVISVNPETKEETVERYYVNLYDELIFQNIEYENFDIEETTTLKPFDVYRQKYLPKTYTITYIDGDDTYKENYVYGENVTLMAPPVNNHPYENSMGYMSSEGIRIDETLTKPSGNIIIYFQWEGKEYNIIYDNVVGDTYRYGEGKKLKIPTKSGYKFEGWYLDGNKITEISETTHGDVSLTSKWTKIISKPKTNYNKPAYWTVNFIVVKNYEDLVPKLNAGYVCYYKGNILLGHNPGVLSWMPKADKGDKVKVNGKMYIITDIFMTKFSNPEYNAWWQPGEFALVTCHGGGLNRLIIVLNRPAE